jgi:predicted secreted protein
VGAISGKDGKISLKVGPGQETFITYVTGWEFDSKMEIDKTAYFGGGLTEEGTVEKIPGPIDWTGSVTGAVDSAELSGQHALFDGHFEGSLAAITLYLSKNSAFMGEAYIENVKIDHKADGKAEFSAGLSGNGKIRKVTLE